jgi:hypothetical protein
MAYAGSPFCLLSGHKKIAWWKYIKSIGLLYFVPGYFFGCFCLFKRYHDLVEKSMLPALGMWLYIPVSSGCPARI